MKKENYFRHIGKESKLGLGIGPLSDRKRNTTDNNRFTAEILNHYCHYFALVFTRGDKTGVHEQ